MAEGHFQSAFAVVNVYLYGDRFNPEYYKEFAGVIWPETQNSFADLLTLSKTVAKDATQLEDMSLNPMFSMMSDEKFVWDTMLKGLKVHNHTHSWEMPTAMAKATGLKNMTSTPAPTETESTEIESKPKPPSLLTEDP